MPERKGITIHDVAARVGVSPMTVSNVLSENKARQKHVSEETRAKVLEAVRLLKYRPNANAVSLRRRRTNIIGFFSGHGYLNAENAFLAAVIGGLQMGCDAHRKDLLVHGTFRGAAVSDIYNEVADGRVDGLVLYTPTDHPVVAMLAESELPVVAITDGVPVFPSVVAGDVAGGRMQVDYLADKGHQRVAFISSLTSSLHSWVSVERRRIGLIERARERGIAVTEYRVAHLGNERHITEADLEWLRSPASERPTAAICWNDLTAYDLIECCDRMGVRVPEDLAVVGYDGVMSTRGMCRRLATVRAPWGNVAATAVSVLVDLIEKREVVQETVLPVTFVPGDTA